MFLYYGYFTCMFTATRIAAELDTGWFGFVFGKYLYLLSMKTKTLLCIIMILSWGILGSGLAAEDILFNRLGVQDGLSSNEITCILKDRKGFMWLGTTSGVNRF